MGSDNVSTKVKTAERDRASELATHFNTNGMVVIRAWRDVFDRLPSVQQRRAIDRAQKRYSNSRPPRVGRGNRSPRRAGVGL